MAGVYSLDEGAMLLDGKSVHFKRVADALAAGISLIHQELNLAENLGVAANIFLGASTSALSAGCGEIDGQEDGGGFARRRPRGRGLPRALQCVRSRIRGFPRGQLWVDEGFVPPTSRRTLKWTLCSMKA